LGIIFERRTTTVGGSTGCCSSLEIKSRIIAPRDFVLLLFWN